MRFAVSAKPLGIVYICHVRRKYTKYHYKMYICPLLVSLKI